MTNPSTVELDPLELHTGILLNQRRTPRNSDCAGGVEGATPERALEEALLPALRRSPCVVAYSGGRDSSALLAAATHIARKHGLEDPIPVTHRFPNHPRADETRWQELTVRHLGLSDWIILDGSSEFDVLGPLAQSSLRKHGLYWPPNAHNLVPLMRQAAHGSLITGNGGDELFTPWMWFRIASIRRGRLRPTRRDLKPLTISLLPGIARRLAYERLSHFGPGWLRPTAMRKLRRRLAAEVTFTGSWRSDLELYLSSRYREVVDSTFRRFADDADTLLVQPFFDSRYVRSVARDAPRDGFGSRSEAMTVHFGKLLPDEVLKRTDKAVFTEALTGAHTREFAKRWNGSGIDPSVADPEAVRAVWLSERPSMQSLTMLQSAYLAVA